MFYLKEQAIRGIYTELIHKLEIRSVVPKLFELKVISFDSKSEVLAKSTDTEKKELIVDKVIHSDNPEAFELFLKALDKDNPNLKRQLEDKLTELCVINLIEDIVTHPQAQGREPDEHAEPEADDSFNETNLKRYLSEPTGGNEASVDTDRSSNRRTVAFPLDDTVRRRAPKLSNTERQEAIDRVSKHRESRGLNALDDSDVDKLIEDLRIELNVTVTICRNRDRDSNSSTDSGRRHGVVDSGDSSRSTSGYRTSGYCTDPNNDPRTSTAV